MRPLFSIETLEQRSLLSAGLDPTFGSGGVVAGYANVLPGGAAQAIALQPDGDILVAAPQLGDPNATSQTFELLRLSPSGSIDGTFGASGVALLGSFPFNSIAAMVLQPDGKILVAGTSGLAPDEDVIIARLNSDGSIDSAFGDAGVVKTGFAVGSSNAADPIVVQPDGKIIVAALTAYDGLGVQRFTATGAVDASFATQGQFTTTQSLLEVTGLALAGNGSILVGADGGGIFVTRLTSDGMLDSTFGQSGTATLTLPNGHLTQIGLQSNGKIIVGGRVGSYTLDQASAMVAARLTQTGALDKSFGTHGITKVAFVDRGEPDPKTAKANANGFAAAMAIGRDGKIVLTGRATVLVSLDDGPGPFPSDFATVRLLASGKIDRSFGTAGKVATGSGNVWPPDYNVANAVAIQPDGSVIVAGDTFSGGALVRYRVDGNLDRRFGYEGRVGPFPISPLADEAAVQPDGKLVVASSSGLARLLASGQLDPTFGDRGLSLQKNDDVDDLGRNIVRSVVGMLIEPDGKILIATSTTNLAQTNSYQITLTRYNSTGSVDRKFGRGGTEPVDVGRGVKDATFQSFTLQPNGKILVLSATAVTRLMPDGMPDPKFGLHGVTPLAAGNNLTQMIVGQGTISIFGINSVPALTNLGTGSSELLVAEIDGSGKSLSQVQSFAINSPNATVTAIAQNDGSDWLFIEETTGVSIYRAEGSEIDSGFNNYKGVISPLTLAKFTAAGNVLLNNGIYYIAGYSGDSGPAEIVAINGDGSIDNNFGTNGVLTLPSSLTISSTYSDTTLLGVNGAVYIAGSNSFARITV